MRAHARGESDQAALVTEATALLTKTDPTAVSVGLLAAWVAAEDEAAFIATVQRGMTITEEDADAITDLARMGAFYAAASWLVS